jgi:hypothetical protein
MTDGHLLFTHQMTVGHLIYFEMTYGIEPCNPAGDGK